MNVYKTFDLLAAMENIEKNLIRDHNVTGEDLKGNLVKLNSLKKLNFLVYPDSVWPIAGAQNPLKDPK